MNSLPDIERPKKRGLLVLNHTPLLYVHPFWLRNDSDITPCVFQSKGLFFYCRVAKPFKSLNKIKVKRTLKKNFEKELRKRTLKSIFP